MPPGAGSERRQRPQRAHLAAALVLLALAGLLVAVPALLLPAATARAPAGASEPRPPRPERRAAPAGRPADRPAPRPPPRARATEPARPRAQAEPPAPVVERRRVQEGPASPIAAGRTGLPQSGRAQEWDRSPAARQRGVETFGGTPLTESAVEAGLAWLAAHQSPGGLWERLAFDRQCPEGDRCPGTAVRRLDNSLDTGLTGLTLLAFLGAGYTDREGPYQQVVDRAVRALLERQAPHGGFGGDESMAGYNDALATLALAEYCALVRDERVVRPLERAVARLAAAQQPLGGWDYVATPGTGRNDTSITAWAVQALHACAAAGIDVPPDTLVRAALHFVRATEPDGRVRYADAGSGFRLDGDLRPVYRYGPGMLAAGLVAEQLLGWRLDGPTPLRQRSLVLAELPAAARARGQDPTGMHSEYYWYYGTLAMFQRGGEDWERWNARLRDALLPLQERGRTPGGARRHTYGSWPPFGANWGLWGRMGGRVYSTAICTLTLEVYYRHTPAFLRDQTVFRAADWRAHLAGARDRERRIALQALGQLRVEIAEPVLVELLGDAEQATALAAAEALAAIDSPAGAAVIEAALPQLTPWEQRRMGAALARARAVAALPPVEGRVRLFDPETGLATLDLPRSYVGMSASIIRDGQPAVRLRIIQRFTGHPVVVAQVVEAAGGPPAPGERILAR